MADQAESNREESDESSVSSSLHELCEKESNDSDWKAVREWFHKHPVLPDGDHDSTTFRMICAKRPPLDIVKHFIRVFPDSVQTRDSFGRLPIHYACIAGASLEVIQELKEAFEEGVGMADSSNGTPLHYAVERPGCSPELVRLLKGQGAADTPNTRTGMLPLHIACCNGIVGRETLVALLEASASIDRALLATDKHGRTAYHLLLQNAGQENAREAILLLLHHKPSLMDSLLTNSTQHSLSLFQDCAQTPYAYPSLSQILAFQPTPTPAFLHAIHTLPEWLRDQVVLDSFLQTRLYYRIGQPFPVAIVLLDLYMIVLVLVFYSINVLESLERRFQDTPTSHEGINSVQLIPLYLGGTYFLLRQILLVAGLSRLQPRKLSIYWFDLFHAGLVLFWAGVMDSGWGGNDPEAFRTGAAVSCAVLWWKLLRYFQYVLIDYSVFMASLRYLVQQMAAFWLWMGIVLVAFALVFYTLFLQTEECRNGMQDEGLIALQWSYSCRAMEQGPFCTKRDSFLRVFTMMIGEVEERYFWNHPAAIALYVVFMFVVVVLLATMLLVLVRQHHRVIQNQRAATVFWSLRLELLANLGAISGLFPNDARCIRLEMGTRDNWILTMGLLGNKTDGSISEAILRFLVGVVVVPVWIVVGIGTAGLLWPPQIRQRLLASHVFSHTSQKEMNDKLRELTVATMKQELATAKDTTNQQLDDNRAELLHVKDTITKSKARLQDEIKEMKKMMEGILSRREG